MNQHTLHFFFCDKTVKIKKTKIKQKVNKHESNNIFFLLIVKIEINSLYNMTDNNPFHYIYIYIYI